MSIESFDNLKNQIGYCGIWCGSCVAGNGVLRDLSARYEKMIKDYAVKEWAPKNFDFDEFLKGVTSLKDIWLCPGCLKGGGQDNCEIRACGVKKNLAECSACDEPQNCMQKEKLETMRTGAVKAGLNVKTEKGDPSETIEKWTREMKKKWPGLLLFLAD
ncbi:MAG: DUF3795 domain-containing protein [Candidatus Aminicenantes bacterium]|nr:DUF3795 domain-containing protein [Candidatus Aminicenantes bacterium]